MDSAGRVTADGVPAAANSADSRPASTQNTPSFFEQLSARPGVLTALLALTLMLAAMLGWLFMRRKKQAEVAMAPAAADRSATILTAGVRASMGEELVTQKDKLSAQIDPAEHTQGETNASHNTQPVNGDVMSNGHVRSAPETSVPSNSGSGANAPAPSVDPLEVEVSLDIIGASRSLMRLSVEFSLEVSNRSKFPVKDLDIAGELGCAREGTVGPSPIDEAQPITVIERIAPQQSRRVAGTLQLPVNEVTTIRQNGKPVVIPLMHFRLGGSAQQAIKRSFVVGTPSASSPKRVHPLVLSGPPGSLPPLRAQLIKQA
ncbi:MAG: hypothetical protein AAGI28_06065 [Pseudomonadota bacterium]